MASDVVSDGQAGGHTRLSRRYTEGVGAGDVSGGRVGTVGEELNYQKHVSGDCIWESIHTLLELSFMNTINILLNGFLSYVVMFVSLFIFNDFVLQISIISDY